MLRTIILSVLMLVSIGVMLPFDDSTAHGIRQSVTTKRHGYYRHHSRAWWRRYRARLRRRRAAAELAAHRNAPLATALPNVGAININGAALVPTLPAGWNTLMMAKSGELRFRTQAGTATTPGQASLAVVALSRPTPAYLTSREQRRLLSGVAFADLRRIVIDKMVAAGGWVINDYERQVNGFRVFVVTAHTPSDGRSAEKAWNFYFTEVDGRIYSLTTNTPPQFADRMAVEAEQFINSLHSNQATSKTQP